MNLVFLHGPPATGKYTVGRELAALTGYPLFHNHLVVDEVLRRQAFGTPEFVAERDRRWRNYLGRAALAATPGVIFTFTAEHTVPQAFIDWLFAELPASGTQLLSVGLTASEATIEARLGAAQRREFKKLTDADFYRELRRTGTFRSPVIPRTDLVVDTENMSPAKSARLVATHFGLTRPPVSPNPRPAQNSPTGPGGAGSESVKP